MKEGDLLHIRGQNEDGTSTKWFAELVGIDEDGKLEVYLLEQTKQLEGHIWAGVVEKHNNQRCNKV